MREFHHRIRNQLAVVRSIFSRTIETAETLEHVADHFPDRLNTVARYQAQLSLTSEVGLDLEMMVCDELITVASANDPRVLIEGSEVRIGHDQASALALGIHELMINSVKYGVLASMDGHGSLRIGWALRDRRLTFYWTETGVSVVASAPIPERFGRKYIEQALPYQLEADTSFEIMPGGVRCTIAFTIDSEPLTPRDTSFVAER
ncbi:sensor histidine kinase [Sphingobium sp.]|uniref:sensor histidine kinase n=1 Tax=Sphingobium sp. TaxID=1912891 RepID=UPI002BD046D9|nr:sensor histidine kinase [Sphingobium sp.]HUD95323.1 sensor histidine kinase [Sphingobium sp.]